MKYAFVLLLLILSTAPGLAQRPMPGQRPVSSGPQLPDGPLSLQDLSLALRRNVGRDMTEADLGARIQRFGIDFIATPELMARFRSLGAHPHLLNVIRRASDKFAPSPGGAEGGKPDPIIEEVRRNVKDYVDELPDFICRQEVQRYIDTDGSGGWQKMDELAFELTYNRKQESYKLVRVNGMPQPPKSSGAPGGASSAGEFASALNSLFDPATQAVFKAAGKERLGTHQAFVYDYHVTQPKSQLSVKIGDDPQFLPAYSGTVWIDADTKQVLRIEQAIEDPPPQYRLFSGDKIIDYEMVKLRGIDVQVLLPVKAEVMMLNRALKAYSRNVIYFKFYQKFESDVKIITDEEKTDKPKPPEKP